MLVAAAVCPAPPLLVPEVAAGAAAELGDARTACSDALAVLAASRPDRLVVVGASDADRQGPYPQGSRGSFRGFGVAEADVRLGAGDGGARPLPAALSVGAWLLEHARWGASPVEGLAVDERLAAERCLEAGRDLAARDGRVALLVMGDGSACRSLKAPGYLDERAEAFDAATARALAAADVHALAALDAGLAQELQAAGRAPWQVLAGAAEGAGLEGRLLYEDAPYGVGYFVAAWS
ncbi:class III extradiol dioxygenase subunit B-like domain-containing protein [Streptomyces sp. NPDC044571]|uniref:class III extradiol dioxygenase subunit B-like domain-containing protein n=1 Tax=Streptomyces sp. NPDC044571 TaxID=3155371 RepID=UPI0033FEBBAA